MPWLGTPVVSRLVARKFCLLRAGPKRQPFLHQAAAHRALLSVFMRLLYMEANGGIPVTEKILLVSAVFVGENGVPHLKRRHDFGQKHRVIVVSNLSILGLSVKHGIWVTLPARYPYDSMVLAKVNSHPLRVDVFFAR
jgi:hypothetical protein